MDPMGRHIRNDHPLFFKHNVRQIFRNSDCRTKARGLPVFKVEKVKNNKPMRGDIPDTEKARVAPTESNKKPSTG
jgi:hypothetical protein